MTSYGRTFYKLTGSGNDFIFVDARREPPGILERPDTIAAICARGTGIGADGIVFVEPPSNSTERFSIRYLNRDGSLAALCGNASLCSVTLAVELGIVAAGDSFAFGTGSGSVHARLTEQGPEIDLQPVTELTRDTGLAAAESEQRIGFATVGVPHLIVLRDGLDATDVEGRGRALRNDPSLTAGANVNFVEPAGTAWRVRTYERGVEAETLACGTGAVATAALLREWGLSGETSTLWTRSGLPLSVRFRDREDGVRVPSLSGEGRIVFRGELAN